ncbi:GNAT family N-acetyltransferase [Lentzea sp. NPDC051208]|uniref:GNAT family N-acetyltransferase n=1 Tax=Lentzea sp. NPDC051208 TaxID=3154642 RepID=UPI0034371391
MLEIKALDLDDDAGLRAYADVRIAAHPWSSREQIIASLRETNPDFGEVIRLIARRDGEGVGITSVGLLGGVNARLAIGPITVHPDHRRQGIGTSLLERLLPELRDRGRCTFVRGTARARTRRHGDGRVELPHDQGERAARLRHRPRSGRGQPDLLSNSVSTGRAFTSCSREHALYPMTSPCSLGRFT